MLKDFTVKSIIGTTTIKGVQVVAGLFIHELDDNLYEINQEDSGALICMTNNRNKAIKYIKENVKDLNFIMPREQLYQHQQIKKIVELIDNSNGVLFL